ncbi:MAG TPA: DoxX family protein [Acidimicrobiales bacterium]|nr:DoxX family protein [Acidimicrobiales bacterium]
MTGADREVIGALGEERSLDVGREVSSVPHFGGDVFVAAHRRITALRDVPQTRDAALVVARVVLAWIFVYHGGGTLFGLWNGAGIHRMAGYFASTAHLHPGILFAYANGIIEFFGGIAVGLGVCSRLAGIALIGDMVVAMITVAWANGIVGGTGGSGYEINLSLLAIAAVVALIGPGRYAVDAAMRDVLARKGPGR